MRKGDKKSRKRKKTVGVKDLPPKTKGGAAVKGGKAGKGQQEYLVVKLSDNLIT